ncbi:MAG: carboxypeptidase regulatory-like domain-containing protein, partial [Vicinamibacterales bacterium]
MSKLRSLLLAAVACTWSTAPAIAQDTGSISGVVFDANGTPVAEAEVRVSGALLPSGRTFTTSDSGAFQFTRLLPGTYTVDVSKTGVGTSKRDVIVELDRVAQADAVLGLTVQETIDVAATRSAVDLRKTEVNLNYNAAAIQELPLERSYRGLFQLVPGVADNRSEVGISAGGSRQDNTYLVDGVNITNPSFGTLSTEVNELDIAEFNVKRGGISAEFGRASGIVTNAISRSGTNQISGQARVEWLPQGLIGDYKNPAFTDALLKTNINPAVSLGGPVLRDKLFFYASARYFELTRGDRTNRLGVALPDRVENGHELFGKITGSPSTRHLINIGYRDRPYTTEATNLDAATDPSVAYDAENKNRVATATWSVFPTSRSTIDVRYLYLKEGFEGVPRTDLGYLPVFNVNNLPSIGYYQDPAQNNVRFGGYEYSQRINYRRHELRGTYTQFMDFGTSTHEIKAGGGYEYGEEDYFRLTNGWGDLVRQTQSGRAVIRSRYYFEQPPQLGQGRTWSAFVQDNVTLGRRLVVNAGLLVNKYEFAQEMDGSGGCPVVALTGGSAVWASKDDRCTMIRFGGGDQVQPRLGLNYIGRESKGD